MLALARGAVQVLARRGTAMVRAILPPWLVFVLLGLVLHPLLGTGRIELPDVLLILERDLLPPFLTGMALALALQGALLHGAWPIAPGSWKLGVALALAIAVINYGETRAALALATAAGEAVSPLDGARVPAETGPFQRILGRVVTSGLLGDLVLSCLALVLAARWLRRRAVPAVNWPAFIGAWAIVWLILRAVGELPVEGWGASVLVALESGVNSLMVAAVIAAAGWPEHEETRPAITAGRAG
ncbi:MAG TPA: hypothetical protein VD970_17795 [Acetobacteraceae bacterium]|nr:hypothetical protein [Acetobacteraceae bacterium]